MQKYSFKALLFLAVFLTLGFNVGVAKAAPVIDLMSPFQKTVDSPTFTLSIRGSGFAAGSVINFNGSPRTRTNSDGEAAAGILSATIPTTDLAVAGQYPITVTNPAPGGGTSNAVTFTVISSSVPTITSISPSSAVEGSTVTITVTGTNFVNGAYFFYGSYGELANVVSSTKITSVESVGSVGTRNISIQNPPTLEGDEGETSNEKLFTVTPSPSPNPKPTITSLSSTMAVAGSPADTLTINGTGFIESSKVLALGTAGIYLESTYVSPVKLTAIIPAIDLLFATTFFIRVDNPLPGGGESDTKRFDVIDNPPPVFVGVPPESATTTSSTSTSLNIVSLLQSLSTAAVSGVMLLKIFKRG